MTWTIADVPDLAGKVAVVTGANSGLGLETARVLASRGAHVVLAVRDRAKAVEAEASIQSGHGVTSTETVELDLASLASVQQAAETVRKAHPRVDILVNNAGVMAMPHLRTEDGFEMQFGVNHLGHWVLTAHMMPAIGDGSHVVSVTSFSRLNARPVDPSDPHLERSYRTWRAYGQSKLANLHFGAGLQHDLDRRGIAARSVVADPGLSHTNLQVRTVEEGGAGLSGKIWRWAARTTGSNQAEGALMLVRAATDPHLRGGELIGPRWLTRGSPVCRRVRRARRPEIDTLWEVSRRETGIGLFDLLAEPGSG